MFTFVKYSNTVAVIVKLFKYLCINIDAEQVVKELDKHPHYPSLLSISDVLTNFNVDNASYYIEADKLADIPCPFLVYTNLNKSSFLVIKSIEDDDVFVSNERWENHKIRMAEFKGLYGGIILIVEPDRSLIRRVPLREISTNLRNHFVIAGMIVISLLSLYQMDYFINITWQIVLLTILKGAGLMTSVLLLIQSIDGKSPLVQMLCNGGDKVNCNAVLSSKAATVFKGLTWSEVGFFYFSGTLLLLLFGGRSQIIMSTLALFNFVALPYTIYSIYYQVRIAKQWCRLCCAIQVLLWAEFIPMVTFPLSFYGWNEAWIIALISLLLPIVLWVLVKPLLVMLPQVQFFKQELRRFKYDLRVFDCILTSQTKFNQPKESWSIVLGSKKASNVVTMVTNPYCQPCANVHRLLDDLISKNDGIQVRIVFSFGNINNDIKAVTIRPYPSKIK